MLPVENFTEAVLFPAIGFVRNVRRSVLSFDLFSDPVRVISLVTQQYGARRQMVQQHIRAVNVGRLSRRQSRRTGNPSASTRA